MHDVLSIRDLKKNYGGFKALKGLNLTIKKGQCVGLLGSNGAGKSTTIRIVTGQLRPTSGHVEVLGINPSLHPKKIHPFIGYIPDSQTLYDDMTVYKNIQIFSELFNKKGDEVNQILKKVHLEDKRDTKVKRLSKGLRQRVLIARALVHAPEFIVLDEPTTGLDPSSSESIYSILENLKNNGATILLTTHLMNDVDRLCDHIVFINRGLKVEEGSPAELKHKHSLPTIEVEILENGEHRVESLLKKGDWLKEVEKFKTRGEILRIKTHEPKLEDIFIKLVEGDR